MKMTDFVPIKKQRVREDKSATSWPPPRLCQRCKQQFDPRDPETMCVFHSEHYSGETAQRWLDPGKNEGGGQMHYFWSCCGQSFIDSPGCCRGKHVTYDETID